MQSLRTCGCINMSSFMSIQAESKDLWHITIVGAELCYAICTSSDHIQYDTQVEFISQIEAHACSRTAWDPTVPIAVNAVFQQSRWRMSQYAGENGLHPRVAGFALSWERGTLSAAGRRERLRESLFPMNKRTPNTTSPPNQPFLFLWQLEVLGKVSGVSCWRR